MVPATNEDSAGSAGPRFLCMTTEAKVGIGLVKHLGINGTMGIMAGRAAFAQGRVFKDKGPGFLPVALGAGFVQPAHGQAAGRFHDIHAMRIMTLHTVHFSFQHWMMIGKMKLGLDLKVTLQTGLRILAGVDDEPVEAIATAQSNMFAARAMAGFTAELAGHGAVFNMQSSVGAGGKDAGNLGVAIGTSCVADISGAFDL